MNVINAAASMLHIVCVRLSTRVACRLIAHQLTAIRFLARCEGETKEGYYQPLERAELVRSGKDVTILCYSRMRYVVMQAVQQLEKMGYDPEVMFQPQRPCGCKGCQICHVSCISKHCARQIQSCTPSGKEVQMFAGLHR